MTWPDGGGWGMKLMGLLIFVARLAFSLIK
jgi:hypothetical protein